MPYSGFPQHDGYENLTENRSAEISGDLHTSFAMDNGSEMSVWILGSGNVSQVFTGLGPGSNLKVKVPYIIVRRRGVSAKFIVVFEPASSRGQIVSVTNADGKIIIRAPQWEDTIQQGEKIVYHRALLR
jgi:hypothetical protein